MADWELDQAVFQVLLSAMGLAAAVWAWVVVLRRCSRRHLAWVAPFLIAEATNLLASASTLPLLAMRGNPAAYQSLAGSFAMAWNVWSIPATLIAVAGNVALVRIALGSRTAQRPTDDSGAWPPAPRAR